MSDSPAAWHPDPLQRHELRYWDGARWTEHVSDRGTVSTDPVDGPPPAQKVESNRALLDAGVTSDLKGGRLVIDGQTLTWKGKGIVLAEVTKVSCWVTKISNAFNYTMQYRIELWAGKDHLKVLWDGKDAQAAATYDSAVATLNQTVVPRLVQKELAAIAATGEAVVAHTRFTRDGISQKKRSASWSEITSIQPVTEARTAVVAGNRAADRAAAVVDHMHPNALVALALVQTCVQTYGRGEQS